MKERSQNRIELLLGRLDMPKGRSEVLQDIAHSVSFRSRLRGSDFELTTANHGAVPATVPAPGIVVQAFAEI